MHIVVNFGCLAINHMSVNIIISVKCWVDANMLMFYPYTTNKNDTAMFVSHNAASIRHHEEVWLHSLTHTHTLTWADTELTCTAFKIHKALHKILQENGCTNDALYQGMNSVQLNSKYTNDYIVTGKH